LKEQGIETSSVLTFMTNAQFHRDNHFVPCVYLKGWTGADGKVATYRLLVPHEKFPMWRRYSPGAIAYHSHLYTQIVSGVEKDDLEMWLGREFETPAEEPLRKARTGARMTPDDWKRLIRFLGAQDVRTPAWFMHQAKRLDEQLPELMKTTMQNALQELEHANKTGERPKLRSLPQEEREGLPLRVTVKRDPEGGGEVGAEILRGRKTWLWTIKRHLTKNISALLQHHWTILAPAKGLTWFTSDNPVVRLNYKSVSDYNFEGGWASPGTEIFLPLDPEHLLFTQVGQRSAQRGERMPREQTELVRRFTAEHAWRMLFALEPDEFVSTFRPRNVDRMQFQREHEQWTGWHDQQTAAEKEMETEPIDSKVNSQRNIDG
jgi:hypothetical protein